MATSPLKRKWTSAPEVDWTSETVAPAPPSVADVVVKTTMQEFRLHKMTLALESKTFENQFAANTSGSAADPTTIDMSEQDPAAVRLLLRTFYETEDAARIVRDYWRTQPDGTSEKTAAQILICYAELLDLAENYKADVLYETLLTCISDIGSSIKDHMEVLEVVDYLVAAQDPTKPARVYREALNNLLHNFCLGPWARTGVIYHQDFARAIRAIPGLFDQLIIARVPDMGPAAKNRYVSLRCSGNHAKCPSGGKRWFFSAAVERDSAFNMAHLRCIWCGTPEAHMTLQYSPGWHAGRRLVAAGCETAGCDESFVMWFYIEDEGLMASEEIKCVVCGGVCDVGSESESD